MAEALPKEPLVFSSSPQDNEDLAVKYPEFHQYEIHLKTHDNEEDYENSKHVISLVKNGDEAENKQMYFNQNEIHGSNFSWDENGGVTFSHSVNNKFVGGHFEFIHHKTSALGSFQEGKIRKPAMLVLKPPEFNVALSKNAGAHAEQEGIGLKLTWNTESVEWKNAEWTEKAFEYSYSVKLGPKIAGQQVYIYSGTFTDPETGDEWKVNNNPGNLDGYVTITITQKGRVNFNKNTAIPPTDPKRTDKDFPSIFPDDMVYEFNEIGTMFNGVMSFGSDVKTATVYAIQGTMNNPFILGHYNLYTKERPMSSVAVSRGKMVVNDAQVAKSGVKHNTLWWNDLSKEHSDATGLPTNGSIEFSRDGKDGLMPRKTIQEPLISAKPRKLLATQPLSSTNLNIYGLIAMNPNAKSKSGTTDVVQEDAMQDFYKIIQYYMDDQLRKDFISLNPPDMTQILNVAVDNRIDNSEFYGFLSFPYLVHALANSPEPLSNELNGARASKMLNQGFVYNNIYKKVYQDQTEKLYLLHFEKHFPLLSEYLVDEKVNAQSYAKLISSDISSWTEFMRTTNDAKTPVEKKALDHSIAIVENLAKKAISQRLYWAYSLFRYFTGQGFLNWLQSSMIGSNSANSQSLAMTIKKIVTMFQLLDPSGEFSIAFLNFLKQYQLTNILPQLLDLTNLSTYFESTMEEILGTFVNEYINSPDKKMSAAALDIQAELKQNKMKPFMDALLKTIQINKGGAWSTVINIYENQIINEFGVKKLDLAKYYSTGVSVLAIIFVITGTTKFSDKTPVSKAAFVKLSYALFQKFATKIITGALKARAAFIAGENSYVEAMSTFFLGQWEFENKPASYLENGFAKWLVDAKDQGKAAGNAAINAAANAEEAAVVEENLTKMKIAFGNNLNEFLSTRIAAMFAMINIVLSSILVSQSSSGLEKAMNGLYLTSSILDLISSVGGWTLSLVATSYETELATVFGFASGLSLLAGVVGCIILIVILTQKKDTPPSPLETFVTDQAAKAGYRMLKGIDIDYFQLTKINGETDKIGLTISESSTFETCIKITSTKSFGLAPLSHESDTVWEISTDEFGYARFATFIYSGDLKQHGVFIKQKNGLLLAEGATGGNSDEEKWICELKDNPSYDKVTKTINGNNVIQKFLKSGTFTIKNVAANKLGVNSYINVESGKLVLNTTPKNWVLTMQGMKPSYLSMKDIKLDKYSKTFNSFPTLQESGSDYGKVWSLSATLPDFLNFDSKTGEISQIKAVVDFHNSFGITVSNHYGSTNVNFKIDASTA